ncbi:TagK domain-containing protein [Burkholderia sp. Ac-20345]|uniref:TagK domain-containing protein n=1 Tax=Burkholderia sp. Ac-20345 TaxID=2703891 RepID=UPI00197C5C6A|nr:TagK domain-containing protein [Burkholderia sp. Ac-20345]MBN3779977.1 TagK domain-containing protein [Burkholderia sp. Ac-20345]
MRSLRLPWRRQPDLSHAEPVLGKGHAWRAPDAAESDLAADESGGDLAANDDVLDRLGIGVMDSAAAHARASSHSQTANTDSPDGLVDALHAQYWRALTDPHATVTAEWAPLVDEPAAHGAAPDSPDALHAYGDHERAGSIEALLFGDHTLADVFERLDGHTETALDVEPVPEILRLFAPPEFQAAAARRGPALPPALTRREHHALTVDSPLSAPSSKERG